MSYWQRERKSGRISVHEADQRVSDGVKALSKDGSIASFDKRLFEHWEHDKDDDLEHLKANRLPNLDAAIKTVEDPSERWDQEGQRIYLKKFVDADGKENYMVVTVDNDGGVRTFYNTRFRGIESARKGISHEVF